MAENPNKIIVENQLLNAYYLERPRIDKILAQATRCRLVYVIAGAGYGKTQAVKSFVEQQKDAIVRWLQLTESDNTGSRYWESLTHNVAFDNPELAARLRELGFPETNARFKQFAAIQKSMEHRSRKIFLVLDDFHLIHSRQALSFTERCANLNIPGACVIIISRTEPDINVVSLFAKGKACIITENELRFTENEAENFFRLRGIQVYKSDFPQIMEATEGWALALGLLALVLKRIPENLAFAIKTMKQNVFKLLESEAWDELPEGIRKTMVRLSLVSDLPLAPFHGLSDGAQWLRDAPALASFMWFDSLTGEYRIHPLYLEFLQSMQDILSPEEKRETYGRAAQWCSENKFYLDAIKYFAKLRQFDRMLKTLLSYPFRLPHDTCAYFLDILENLEPDENERNHPGVLLLLNFFMPLLLLWMGRYEEASERSWDVIREWGHSELPIASTLLCAAYSNLAYIDMYACVITHKYDAPKHLRRSIEYRRLSSPPPASVTGPFSIADIRSFACLVGEGAALSEFDEFLNNARETALYVAQTPHSMYYGYEDLVACELAFYKNQLEPAKSHAHEAIIKGREKNQHSIEAMAAFYLFRIAMQEGDYPLVQELLKHGRDTPGNPNFWNRHLLYELGNGFLYAMIGRPEMMPAWLIADEKETAFDVSVPVIELICAARYYLISKKYGQALTLLSNSCPRKPRERFLFGELALTLMTAAARIRTGDAAGAVRDFEKAYALSFDGVFEMPFVELGKDLHPLVAAAGKHGGCRIPEQWMKTMDRKASAYAKKLAAILYAFKKEKKIEDIPQLSEREREVLNDLYHGLSREEIAASRFLSINTVNKIIPSIFIKLDANNSADAIRIAIEKKLIE